MQSKPARSSSDANDPGVQMYTDSNLVTEVRGDDDDIDDEETEEYPKNCCPVSNSEAPTALNNT